MRPPLAVAVALLAAGALAGCGSALDIARGGRVGGTTLSVYSLLPQPGIGGRRDMVDAEKLALLQARGSVGRYTLNFVSIDEGAPGATDGGRTAAAALRDALADPQVVALIGPSQSDTATATVPLLNGAGILEVTPGAGYAGFTQHTSAQEPDRWQPSGQVTLARMAGDDLQQAPALLAAAGTKRIFAVREPGPIADALVAGLRDAGATIVASPRAAGAVVYAGEDPVKAAAAAARIARQAPHARIVLPDAVVRDGVAPRLSPAARRRTVLVTSAPAAGSSPALRAFATAFRAQFGRTPSPYAAITYDAMRDVLAAVARAGTAANSRQAIIDAYFALGRRDGATGGYRITPVGRRDPAPFRTVRP